MPRGELTVDAFNKKSVLVVQDGQPMWDGNSDVQPRWITIKKELRNLAKSKSVTSSEVEVGEGGQEIQERERGDDMQQRAQAGFELGPLRKSITLSQVQIASLLANAFYCTFPRRNATGPQAEYCNYPTINFQRERERERKMRQGEGAEGGSCLKEDKGMRENEGETDKDGKRDMERKGKSTVPRGLVTFSRCHVSTLPDWKSCTALLPKLYITSEGLIEKDGQGMLQVDFSHNLVGGGVLGNGLVQEEILFLINPEMIVARLFTEKLGDNDCLKITVGHCNDRAADSVFLIGHCCHHRSQQYSKYTGYSDSFKWTGPHEDKTPRQIIAIDALHLKHPKEQYNMRNVRRELNKAYCGFKGEDNTNPDCYPAVATGNWGCGVFGGDPRLKALIQLMAAAEARRDVAYFTFEMKDLEMDILRMYNFLKTGLITVAQLYKSMEKFWEDMCTNGKQPSDLYSCIRSYLEKSKN
ncbi:hypothetical protein JZ751_016226 [Albula glossodonta]|uniref:poly(ADP-ribose) glycohydrolase n=1 Tax=Albula glossodonta TaxID=121402 RepID=A0A8T2MUK6_9TELE|nr:hypothetical protein JZ751_016226 [Albula glossodonta]